ncbi:MAG: DUF1573 domain-containing protein [Thermodesulfobacteriota bacterium]|nr:DUF1573 domain-containing protein [Thermodesulfobacteriota bacterium]
MMRCCLLLLLLLLSCGSVFADPLLVVERLNYDFGETIQGTKIDTTFRFQNAGDQVLEISRLRSSCGCTAALLSTKKLVPGAIGELRVTFDSDGFRGAIHKRVTFETNDPKHTVVTFGLQGKVKVELFLQPNRINWGIVKKNMPLLTELEIVNRSKKVITLQKPTATNAGIMAELSSLTIAPGEETQLKVSAEFPVGKKRLAGYIIINSDFPSLPQLKVPVSARLSQQ